MGMQVQCSFFEKLLQCICKRQELPTIEPHLTCPKCLKRYSFHRKSDRSFVRWNTRLMRYPYSTIGLICSY